MPSARIKLWEREVGLGEKVPLKSFEFRRFSSGVKKIFSIRLIFVRSDTAAGATSLLGFSLVSLCLAQRSHCEHPREDHAGGDAQGSEAWVEWGGRQAGAG